MLIILAVIVLAVLQLTNTTHFFHKTAVVRAPAAPISHLTGSNKQSTGSTATGSSTATNKTPSTTPALSSESDKDENGQAVSGVPSNPSEWSTSSSGEVTVKLPTANETMQSGATVTGVASSGITQVQYRLTDNVVGVISEGTINVVNGTFTAEVNFQTSGTTGRLDVFTTDSTGKELNEVQIPVNF